MKRDISIGVVVDLRRQFRRTDRSAGRRRAFSLIELMVVILILLSVTAISIPLVAPAMSGRQVREAARMVSTFINAARNRAIETGRPAGIWIERLPGLREAATNLYYAEIPPVYAGDFLDSSVELFVVNGVPVSGNAPMNGNIFTWESTDSTCKDYWNIVVPRGRTVFNADAWASPSPLEQTVVREGDLIQIEGSDRKIPLKTVKMNISGATSASSQGLWWYLYRGRNCAWNLGPDGPYTNERQLTGEWVIRWFDRNMPISWNNIRTTTVTPMNQNAVGLKYKIYRQPIKLQAGSIKLPDGTCIDLSFSSVTNGDSSNSGLPLHPRTDKSNFHVPFWGAANYPQDETPIILVFSPGGHVERMYFRMTEGLANTAATQNRQWVWGGVEPFGQIHFLIGKIEKIFPDEFFEISKSAKDNFDIQTKKNWLDLENFWVNVNPQTGFISTSIVDDITTYGVTYFDPANTQTGASNPNNVYMSRYKARYARLAGGK
jgi:prepilin-type N-terminal cleavage/methylation domain-containing protein